MINVDDTLRLTKYERCPTNYIIEDINMRGQRDISRARLRRPGRNTRLEVADRLHTGASYNYNDVGIT